VGRMAGGMQISEVTPGSAAVPAEPTFFLGWRFNRLCVSEGLLKMEPETEE
jgi:hypothetical protein